jgi:hypothetical protein
MKDPTLLADLERLLEPATMGDPMRPLRWVSKSHDKFGDGASRAFNRKTKEGGKHPDRGAQVEYINAKVEEFHAADQPAISIDAKKKELLGEFKNGGSDYGPQGRPIEATPTISKTRNAARVVPYGVYDIGANDGYISLGIEHDTGQFAVNSVRLWVDRIGR